MKKSLIIIVIVLMMLAIILIAYELIQNNENNVNKNTSGNVSDIVEENFNEKYFSSKDLGIFNVVQVISLEENPTTGYGWEYVFDDDKIAQVEEDEYTQNKNDAQLSGVGGVHAYRISGLMQGKTVLTFKYRRLWETEASIEEVKYEIEVNGDNKIAVMKVNIVNVK